LLSATGYAVSFDPLDQYKASVILHRDPAKAEESSSDPRTLHLRDTSHVAQSEISSIYRYDRVGLISAIEQKLAGRA
jgi:two-component system, chemotaxis family, sensor kinase CheA